MNPQLLTPILQKALNARLDLIRADNKNALRLFNGFTEGLPELSIEIFGTTLVFYNYDPDVTRGLDRVQAARQVLESEPSLTKRVGTGLVKSRQARSTDEKRGQLLFGETIDTSIDEFGVHYALNLTLQQDASLYLDTRLLRAWLKNTMQGLTMLNTFAYTGSLGVAALAGGAGRVVQLDRNRAFLDVGRASYTLNHFPIHRQDFLAADFFPAVNQLKRVQSLFDCVVIDPPFFSNTAKGRVDQVHSSERLINKVRPLIADGGYLVATNNALYVSGQQYLEGLQKLCADGYLSIEQLIDVPADCVGYSPNPTFVTDPAPFNHPTKIAVLRVRRKQRSR